MLTYHKNNAIFLYPTVVNFGYLHHFFSMFDFMLIFSMFAVV